MTSNVEVMTVLTEGGGEILNFSMTETVSTFNANSPFLQAKADL